MPREPEIRAAVGMILPPGTPPQRAGVVTSSASVRMPAAEVISSIRCRPAASRNTRQYNRS